MIRIALTLTLLATLAACGSAETLSFAPVTSEFAHFTSPDVVIPQY